jgi:glycosyltransferase involved in cell wall biosynthesis
MKILYCIPGLEHGGAERQLSYLGSELASMGHEVHVASSYGGPNLHRLQSAGVKWHCIGRSSNRDPRIFFRLIALMRKLRPDVVQTILTPMDFLGGAAALLTRTPWILKESSSGPLYAAIWKYTGDWRYKVRFAFGRLSDAVVSNSAGGYDYWRSARDGRPLHMIPNGLPLDEIAASDPARVNGFAFGPDEKLVLYAGRIDLAKNVESLIATLARIADEVPFAAVICGDGSRRPHVERMARELGVAHRIFFTGYVDHLWDLMKRADAVVSLSRFEGRPNVVLEAMACGCPLVVSDIPAHREILNDSTAYFVRPDEPEQVAEAIKTILQSQAAAQARAQAARAKTADWGLPNMALMYEHLYLNLLGKSDITTISDACNLFARDGTSFS